MRRRYPLVATVALVVPLLSCASPQDWPASASRKPDEAVESVRLTGTEWVLETLDGRDPSGGPFTLGFFEDGYFEGEAVCNHFGARHAPGTDFQLSEELGRTNFECGASEAARREEAEFLEIMAQADGLDAAREELEIEDSTSGRTLVFVPKPPPSAPTLDGTEWVLVSLRGRAPVDGPPVTIEFYGEGDGGSAGCNRYGVRFEGAPEAPRIATVDMTATCCPSKELAHQEEDYVQALGEYAGHEVLGDRLKVLDEGGETLLTYKKRKGKRNNDPAAFVPPNRSADMEGTLASIEPSVPLVEDCAPIPAASSVTTMTHSPGGEQPCDVPGVGAVGQVLVEHDEGEWVDKMRLAVTEETLVLRHSREGFVRVPFEELEGGQFKSMGFRPRGRVVSGPGGRMRHRRR